MCKCNQKNESKYLKNCRYCFDDIYTHEDFIHYLSKASLLCGKCRSKLVPLFQFYQVKGMKVFAFYLYNRFLEGMLFQYKEGRDTALKDVFFDEVKTYIERHYRNHTIVLMPSSIEKTKERGFYAMDEMTYKIRLPKLHPFIKTYNIKQSMQRYEQRDKIQEIMVLKEDVVLPKGPLLLLDDVMTSGATMHRAYTLLKPYRPLKVCVLAFHELLLEDCQKHCRKLRPKQLAKKSEIEYTCSQEGDGI